jgi:hypothetical protein
MIEEKPFEIRSSIMLFDCTLSIPENCERICIMHMGAGAAALTRGTGWFPETVLWRVTACVVINLDSKKVRC